MCLLVKVAVLCADTTMKLVEINHAPAVLSFLSLLMQLTIRPKTNNFF